MPLNKLHVPRNLPVETCCKINDLLHDSLVETCGVNPEDYFCIIARYAPEDMILHPTYLGERDVSATVLMDITLLKGRSEEQKESLHADVRKRLKAMGFPPGNAIIYLTENDPIDWSFSPKGSVKKVLGL
ncbi:tautomerase family protein [Labrenzia sp. R4_1]|uniref:tautomerase family protein n=1 Tax=Stappiaceae TaxID=2821832 RepID=UPI00092B4F12|nr:tautomerase family protein [Labrenzia sp. R4_1]MBO9427019.1 tautomerase family protein [Labrenzia sp. R4_1]OJJ12036.1 tautomerase family protein [Alphaproteobacteria bacterium AO1-B]